QKFHQNQPLLSQADDFFDSLLVAYGPDKNMPWKGISHQIAVYPDEQAASLAYPKWEEQWFTYASESLSSTYHPRTDDVFRYEYIEMPIDDSWMRSYTYLQRHDNLIILVLANIDGQYLTQDDFEQVLEKLDQKLQTWQP
ncbi:MAG: hypothetical protein GY796_13465, partial [Chloroflexi bacterium]|nr:hypothetical protein [Chloroflexota bacterium]